MVPSPYRLVLPVYFWVPALVWLGVIVGFACRRWVWLIKDLLAELWPLLAELRLLLAELWPLLAELWRRRNGF